MSPQEVAKALSTFVLSSIYSLWLRVATSLSRLISILLRIVRRIKTGSISSQLCDELMKIAELKQSEIHSQTLEQDRTAVEYDREIFRQCVLEGEQQAKCFTLALLFTVFVGIMIARFGRY